MSAAAAVGLRLASTPERGAIELLRAVLDEELLSDLGWDAEGMVVHARPAHVSFGFAACEVPDCGLPVTRSQGTCGVCWQRYTKASARGESIDLDAFKRIPRRPPRVPERICAVCCVAPDFVRPAERRGLCVTHVGQRRRYEPISLEEFVAREDVRPYPSFGTCRRVGCERWAAGRRQLCGACEATWASRGRPDLDAYCAEPYVGGPVAMVAPIRLDGLPKRVVLELLYVAQKFTEIHRKRCREGWRGLVRDARMHEVGSLLDLERGDPTSLPLQVRRLARRELEVLYADRETEFAADVWDLRKVGLAVERHTRILDFRALRQRSAA